MKEDIKNRKKRANGIWFKVKKQLKNTRLSKRTQAKIVEACVENALLFDCNARTWWGGEMKELQSYVDRCYRYVWSNKTGPPLIQMQREGVNSQDIRSRYGIRSVRWKVEKRVLERIGHVMRMDDGRTVKQAILGWWEELENWGKAPGKKRKTVLYWKRLVREAGRDWTEVGRETEDRKKWKAIVEARMEHLKTYEEQRGKRYRWRTDEQRVERNPGGGEERGWVCPYPECGRECKSKAGLVNHRRRIHEVPGGKKEFVCDRCNEKFKSKGNWATHRKGCGGEAGQPGRARCATCGGEVSKTNIARHRRTYEARAGVTGRAEEALEDRGGGTNRKALSRAAEQHASFVRGSCRRGTWQGISGCAKCGPRRRGHLLDWSGRPVMELWKEGCGSRLGQTA